MTEAYRFIAAEKANYPVSVMSLVLGVNRAACHRWEGRAPSQRALANEWLSELIRTIHAEFKGVYGAPRILAELGTAHGVRIGRERVESLMASAGYRASSRS